MKEVVKEMLAHPIASLVIIGAIGSAAANIVRAAKGCPKSPFVGLNIGEETAKRVIVKLKDYPNRKNEKIIEPITES